MHAVLQGSHVWSCAPCTTNKEKETHLLILNRFIRHLLSATCGERSWRAIQSAQQLWPSPGCSSRRTRSHGQQIGFPREIRRKGCDVQGGLDGERLPKGGEGWPGQGSSWGEGERPQKRVHRQVQTGRQLQAKECEENRELWVLKAKAGVRGLRSWVFILMLTGRHRAVDQVGPPSGKQADTRPGRAGLPLIQPPTS